MPMVVVKEVETVAGGDDGGDDRSTRGISVGE